MEQYFQHQAELLSDEDGVATIVEIRGKDCLFEYDTGVDVFRGWLHDGESLADIDWKEANDQIHNPASRIGAGHSKRRKTMKDQKIRCDCCGSDNVRTGSVLKDVMPVYCHNCGRMSYKNH